MKTDRLTEGNKEAQMTYKYFQDESKALAYVAIEKARGRQAYMLRWRLGTIEVRSWV